MAVRRYIRFLLIVTLGLSLHHTARSATPPDSVPAADSVGVAADTLSHAATMSEHAEMPAASAQPFPKKTSKFERWFTRYPNSGVALLCSIVPGGGQLYNRRYWKIPVVLSAMTGGAYAVTWNQRLYKEYHTAYADLLSENPLERTSWQAFIPRDADPAQYVNDGNLRSRLEKGSKQYKENRDLSIVVTVALYLLSALDAYVDAELYYFNVSPNLTVDMGDTPANIAPQPKSVTVGASIHF